MSPTSTPPDPGSGPLDLIATLAARAADLLRSLGTRASFVRLLVITVTVFTTFAILRPAVYLDHANLQYIELASPEIGMISLAMSLCMLTGGIDLSVVGIANLSGVVSALSMSHNLPVPTAVGLGLIVAIAAGALNGVLVGYVHVPPILATLGTSQLFTGLALVVSDGTVVKGMPSSFTNIAVRTEFGVPLIFWALLVVAALLGAIVGLTSLGFRMRLIGANMQAAAFSGIRANRVLLATYVLSGLLAAVAGLIISARAAGASSNYGTSYVLLAIVIAVLAGVNPYGGYLTVAGVVVATVALQLLSSGLLSLSVSSYIINIAQGVLLAVMVLLNTWSSAIAAVVRNTLTRGSPTAIGHST